MSQKFDFLTLGFFNLDDLAIGNRAFQEDVTSFNIAFENVPFYDDSENGHSTTFCLQTTLQKKT